MPRRKLRALMVHWDGAGNQPPQRALARELGRRGHEVHVLSHDSVADRARSDGATFHRLATALQFDDSQTLGLPVIFGALLVSPAWADDFRAVVRALEPDVVLVDIVLRSVLVAAAELGIPTVAVAHSIYAPEVMRNAFAAFAGASDDPARAIGERASAFEASLPLILVPSYAAFSPVADCGPAVTHVGPIREAVAYRPWPRRLPARPFVLVSLSTSFMDQSQILQRICNALGALEVEALVTTGPNMPHELFSAASQVELRSFVAHDEVLPSADLVITHSGHGTVMAAAGAGVPMLCLPMGRDQPFVASRVAALGLGSVLAPTASSDEVAETAAAMLAEPRWAAAAQAFAAGVPRFGELQRAAELVEQLA